MVEAQKHIIGKYTWDTTFDKQEKSWELQNTLSHWSKYHLQDHVDRIFNALCPEEHTVKIKRLELDLGVIDYVDLHQQLPANLETKLRERLLDLIRNPEKSSHLIKIEPSYASLIKVLKHFLQKGVMPWYHHPEMGTANDLFDKLRTQDSDGLLQMLLETAKKDTVRKRLAWQFKEAHIKQTVALLEPNHHTYIFKIVDELGTVQEKENIISSSSGDFKKNLWYWVLSYLFEKRDSLFNKVAFVKSNLLAMSNHFNLAYDQLLDGITTALERLNKALYKTVELLTVLHMVTEEYRQKTAGDTVSVQPKPQWADLERLASKANNTLTLSQERELNTLVQLLAIKDGVRFKQLFFENEKLQWSRKLGSLTETSKQALIHTLLGKDANALLDDLAFIRDLDLEKLFGISANELWKMAYSHALTLHSKTYGTLLFLQYLIAQLTDKANKHSVVVLEALLRKEVPVALKVPRSIPTFHTLKTLLLKKRGALKTNVLSEQFDIPTDTGNDAIARPFPTSSDMVFPVMPVENEVPWAIAVQAITVAIQKIATQLTENTAQLRILGHWIKPLGLQISSRTAELGTFQFLLQLLEATQLRFGTDSRMDLARYFRKILIHPQLKNLVLTEQQHTQLLTHAMQISKRGPWVTMDHLIQSGPDKQQQLSDLLAVLVHDKQTEHPQFKKREAKLASYLLPQGQRLQQETITSFAKEISSEQTSYSNQQLEQLLGNWFWQCIADYSAYQGNKGTFIRHFQKAVSMTFPKTQLLAKNHQKDTKGIAKEKSLVSPATKGLLELFKTKGHSSTSAIIRALETAPHTFRLALLEQERSTDFLQDILKRIPIDEFLALVSQDIGYSDHTIIKSMHVFYSILVKSDLHIGRSHMDKLFRKYTIAVYTARENAQTVLKNLVGDCFLELDKAQNDGRMQLTAQIQIGQTALPSPLKLALATVDKKFLLLQKEPDSKLAANDLQRYHHQTNTLVDLIAAILIEGKIPAWFQHAKKYTLRTLLQEVLQFYPLLVLKVLREGKIAHFQLIKLYHLLDFSQFTDTLIQLYPGNEGQLKDLRKLYFSIGAISNSVIQAALLQEIVALKILKAWKAQQWQIIAPKFLWSELFWEVCAKKEISKERFFEAFTSIKTSMPMALVIPYTTFYKANNKVLPPKENRAAMNDEIKNNSFPATNAIPVPNAGLVLLNAYVPMLLERLELVANKAFASAGAQETAVHYLQYVVTGLTHTEEHLLPLNKLFCGLPLDTPVKDGITVLEHHKSMVEGLITSCLGYWPAIGSCSVNGFRGNWLVRNGILEETETNWNLNIEKRPYDILLSKAPFSFSIIKFPWMKKPLHVTWSY